MSLTFLLLWIWHKSTTSQLLILDLRNCQWSVYLMIQMWQVVHPLHFIRSGTPTSRCSMFTSEDSRHRKCTGTGLSHDGGHTTTILREKCTREMTPRRSKLLTFGTWTGLNANTRIQKWELTLDSTRNLTMTSCSWKKSRNPLRTFLQSKWMITREEVLTCLMIQMKIQKLFCLIK